MSSFVPANARINRIWTRSAVSCVFGIGAYPKISPSVINGVSVDVIYHKVGGRGHNYAVHTETNLLPINLCFSHSVPESAAIPLPLIEPFVILIINQCYLALRELYFFCHLFLKAIAPQVLTILLSRQYGNKRSELILSCNGRATLPRYVKYNIERAFCAGYNKGNGLPVYIPLVGSGEARIALAQLEAI